MVARNHQIARMYAFQAALNPFQDPAQLAALDAGDVIAGYRQFSRRFLGATVERGDFSATTERDSERPQRRTWRTSPARRGWRNWRRSAWTEASSPASRRARATPAPANLFSPTVVYERGALTLHALRLLVGDEAFFAILREWTGRFHNGNATTEDFVALAEEVSGEELDAFFEAWLYEPALPDLPAGRDTEAASQPRLAS